MYIGRRADPFKYASLYEVHVSSLAVTVHSSCTCNIVK